MELKGLVVNQDKLRYDNASFLVRFMSKDVFGGKPVCRHKDCEGCIGRSRVKVTKSGMVFSCVSKGESTVDAQMVDT